MKLQPNKCEFLNKKFLINDIMGHTGVRPDEKRIKAVKEYPEPRTTQELKGFLGLAGYYR